MTGPGRRLAWRRLGRIKSAEAAGIVGWANGIATGNWRVCYGNRGTLGSMISVWFTGWFSTVNKPVGVFDLQVAPCCLRSLVVYALPGLLLQYMFFIILPATCYMYLCLLRWIAWNCSHQKLWVKLHQDIACYWDSVAIILPSNRQLFVW